MPGGRDSRRRGARGRLLLGALAAGALAIALAAVLASRPHSSAAERDAPFAGAGTVALRSPGLDPIAAAYRHPLRCLTFTVSAADPAYARAQLDRAGRCALYTGWVPTIFRRVDGGWRAVLEEADYSCPVASLPAVVQAQLGVCPR